MYPELLKLDILETQHPEYVDSLEALGEIELLTSGGYKLKKRIKEFLPKRPTETEEVYELRLKKFTYLNIMSYAINEQVNKLNNSTLSISGIEGKHGDFWNTFRENTNLAGRSEKSLISHIFREILKFKKIFLHVDKPVSPIKPNNKLQEEKLGIRPYVVTYSPLQVINWSESKGKLAWVKIKQIIEDTSNPLVAPVKKALWTIIDSKFIAKYEAEVEIGKDGQISKVNGDLVNEDTQIPIHSLIEHGLGVIPILKVELPAEMWVADQVSSKALEHLRTDCSKYDLLTLSYFQRTFKRVQKPDNDLNNTFEDDEDVNNIDTGLQHVLNLEKFEWSEPQGHIIPHMIDTLRQIESQIRDLVGLGGLSAEKGIVQQSGESKKLDLYKQEAALRAYGELLINAYQDLLQLVAKSAGVVGDNLSVTGFSTFENDTVESLISKIGDLSSLDIEGLKAKLPPSAFRSIYTQLIVNLMGNPSAEEQEIIHLEIDNMLTNSVPLDTAH